VSTFYLLNTLIGIVNSRKNKFNPTGPIAGATPSPDPNQANPSLPVNPATGPANQNPAAHPSQSDWTSATAFQENASNTPLWPNPDGSKNPALLQSTGAPRPSPMPPTQNSPQTEDSLRQQLQQSDIYDLSGEKAAAEALKRDNAFKEQQLAEKAQQTKEFFADQDRKQQETLQDVQKQADQQLQEKSQKEFWDQKQQTEMQAGMQKELLGLHEAARQEHQEWRNDFTQGICRDDVAALYNKDITDRVGAYKERLDDIGKNPVDSVQTIEKYKVKLQDEAAPQIEQKTGELHQEHFPEYSSAGNHIDGHGPDGHGPDHPPEPPPEPEEEPEGESSAKMRKSGPGITYPDGGPRADMPGLGGREAIRKGPASGQEGQPGGDGVGEAPPPGVDQSKFAGAYASKSGPETEQSKGPEDSKFLNPNPERNQAEIEGKMNTRKETWENAGDQVKAVTEKVNAKFTGKAEKGPIDLLDSPPTQASQVADWQPNPHPLTDGSMAGPELATAVVVGAALWKGAQLAKEKGGPLVDSAKEFGENVKVAAGEMAEKAMYAAGNAMDRAQGAFDGAVDSAKELGANLKVAAGEASEKAMYAINDAMDTARGTIESGAASIGEGAQKVWNNETFTRLRQDESGYLDLGGNRPNSTSDLNPNLRSDYEQLLKERGEDVSGGMKKFDAQAVEADKQVSPAPTIASPEPSPSTPAPTPAPSAAEPAPSAPTPAPAPAPQQPAPSISPSL